MFALRVPSVLLPFLLVLTVAASCATVKDTEAFVPADRGAFQPDAGGPLLSEAVACSALLDAETEARRALGCTAATHVCPGFIRPAGGADCFEYSRQSVTGCELLYASFASCEDFALHPCLVSAVSACNRLGEAGAGGAPSEASGAGAGGA